ncbi:preprotein translocase subunit SecE [Campylobacter sp. MIT 21-1685]|uniref:preprotein translocase subunit SecE n=1 Tax=unclassified Campylobacter TaxID=2593542 RepID=UPI00224B5012|nr:MULTISPECIES: preprotein translocase subunit SecE [unclassified Campylobacter]MCX2683739.1 preprotein translocase subunit SecE [Campylobacter sp. MIT 21-1684]MCX2752031.1 preprotein translocase subunit SecE [Campylobacter sp. MIT 21-1682]MCX2808216.1 preprotein translocase subunit SecE [Campylobacter sp. MIT 21-1685]
MEKLITYLKTSKAELRKVIFPLKEQVRNAYIAVFIVVVVVSLFLTLVDWIMSSLVSAIV